MHHAPRLSRHLTRQHRQHTFFSSPTPIQHRIHRRNLLTLAIETSCDDTCVAILETRDGRDQRASEATVNRDDDEQTQQQRPLAHLHFDEKITAKNSGLGGIHPLEALSSHRANLAKLVDRALGSLPAVVAQGASTDQRRRVTCRDGSVRRKPDFISVTRGPGMRSNLLCGLELAKGLAVAWQVPLVGVHHMQAHALTPRLIQAMETTDQSLEHRPGFPFLTLLVSGGHTMLLYSTGLLEHKILASTADVAIGDALDRTGWLLLPRDTKTKTTDTAFGKHLSQYAYPDQNSFDAWPVAKRRKDEIDKPLNKFGWQMQTSMSETREMAFSFGSIESRVSSILKQRENVLREPLSSEENILLARTAIGSAFEHLGSRIVIALENLKNQNIVIQNLVVSGGVAANNFLRFYLRTLLTVRGFENVGLIFPPVKYCTDNAAMIGWAGVEMYQAGYSSKLSIDSLRKWSMDAESDDGGILGVGGWNCPATNCKATL